MTLPKSYHDASLSDIRHRFQGSFIEYRDELRYVAKCAPKDGNLHLFILDPDSGRLEPVKVTSTLLSIKGLGNKLGMFELFPGVPACVKRTPQRRMLQGLSSSNCLLQVYIDGVKYAANRGPGGHGIHNVYYKEHTAFIETCMKYAREYSGTYESFMFFHSPGFHKMYQGRYTSAYMALRSDSPAVVLSKRHVLTRDEFGDRYLLYNFQKVAKLKNDRLVYLPNTSFLKEETERTTGLKPA